MPPPENPSAWLETFADLDPGLPLLLLPVRIETRYRPDGAPTELLVRLFPDTIHADGHAITPSASEQDLGRAFWERTWRASGDPAGETRPSPGSPVRWGPGVRRSSPARYAHGTPAARRTPRSPTTGRCGLRRSSPRRRIPGLRADPGTPAARTLRGRRVRQRGLRGPCWGTRIPADLAMAPGPAELDAVADRARGRWLEAQGLAWTFDFAEAERVGMGVRIDLERSSRGHRGVLRTVVVGVRADDEHESLEALLAAHRYTHGLDFIPQGTPTNRTETAPPGSSPEDPGPRRAARGRARDARSTAAAIGDEGDLYRHGAADAASIALGLGRDNALDRADATPASRAGRAQRP